MEKTIAFTVNGQSRSVITDPDRPLLEVLREELQLTGTKYGCGEGKCRACTVLMGGRSVVSCITPVSAADKQNITTIEGLASGDALHPVQEAFLAEGAMQCGYCTPGMVLEVAGLLEKSPRLSETDIMLRLESHLCRCNGYPKIHNAVKRAVSHNGRQ